MSLHSQFTHKAVLCALLLAVNTQSCESQFPVAESQPLERRVSPVLLDYASFTSVVVSLCGWGGVASVVVSLCGWGGVASVVVSLCGWGGVVFQCVWFSLQVSACGGEVAAGRPIESRPV